MSVKISELTAADSVGNSDVLPIVQSGSTKKVTTSTLLSGKQDILTAGTGIDITSNTISVDGGVIQTITTDTNIWSLMGGIYKVTGLVKLYYMSGQYISIPSGSVGTLVVGSVEGIKHYQLFYDDNIFYGMTTSMLGTSYKYETQENKVTSISSSSTDTQYPSAKCVYDFVGENDSMPQGSIIQYDGNTIPAGYEEANGFDNYSTTEHVVGTWIDGKPIYEVTIINYSVTLNGGYALLGELNISVDHFVSADWAVGSPAAQNNAWRTGYLNADYYSGIQVSMVDNKYSVYIFGKDSNTNPIKAMATIRYTKTTDNAS